MIANSQGETYVRRESASESRPHSEVHGGGFGQ
jgi:hypothetical protein